MDDEQTTVVVAVILDVVVTVLFFVVIGVKYYLYQRAHRRLISSLPAFTFSPMTYPDPLECVICMSEFEDGETGRILPLCKHTFHSGCIDTWIFFSTTCPLCRAGVKPAPELAEPRPGVAEPDLECQHDGGEDQNRYEPPVYSDSSSMVGVTVEVPGREGTTASVAS